MKILTIVALGIVVVALIALVFKAQESQIKDKVASVGGEFISCESRFVEHPFGLIFKGEQVYQFTYRLQGEVKEGFVKFSLFTDWRL